MLKYPYAELHNALKTVFDEQSLFTDPLHTLAYGTDASFYRMLPKIVVKVRNESEVRHLLHHAMRLKTPVTFRASGTSLSGQAVTDSVLAVMEGNSWQGRSVLQAGEIIRLEPGVIGATANALLAPLKRKIGPDPASINAARIGGIAANNSSGMCCGTAQNSYHTLSGMRVVFADGRVLDTRDDASVEAFRAQDGGILSGLAKLAAEVRANEALTSRICHKFRLKNTTGYSINALIDFDDPVDILQHLLIGSEGTLGFISEIDYRTVHDHPNKATALGFFADIETACRAVTALKSEPVDAVELMDRAALRSVESKPGMPAGLAALPESAAALLIDVRAADQEGLAEKVATVQRVLAGYAGVGELQFTTDPVEYQRFWNVRKGLFPAVGAVRPNGTTVIIEDVAFPLERLAEGTLELQQLFVRHHYHEAIIFGHALEGNLHFVFTQDFSTDAEVKRYEAFMHDVSELVAVRYGGSLKAEHGTGRNMAPFVELEWGADAYALMWRIKDLFDPTNLLNPGVILNRDPDIHLKNLKPLTPAHELVDRCIECGFCEPICPSRNLTLTPRQRITSLREMQRLENTGEDAALLKTMRDSYQYDGVDTCAVDGLCATQCPVLINTGELVRDLRSQQRGALAKKTAGWIDDHMAGVTATTRASLKAVRVVQTVIGNKALESISSGITKLSGDRVPAWHASMPGAPKGQPASRPEGPNGKVVYFPSCVSRSMGTTKAAEDQRALFTVMDSLLEKAGVASVIPDSVDGLCCGMPFASKGLPTIANESVARLEAALWAASDEGQWPVLCDTSPCTLRMIEQFTRPLTIMEPSLFIEQHLMPHLEKRKSRPEVMLHVTCSSRKMGLDGVMQRLAEACADKVILPEEKGCCGFAGDKGFSLPQLNAAALQNLRQQVPASCSSGVSNSLTCEIGLSRHSGVQYQSIAYLVDECFGAKS